MIRELNQEGNVTLTCMIARAEIGRTTKNTPYLTLALQDASGTLDSRYWNLSEEEAKAWKEGMVVEARGELKRYRNAWQMRVFALKQIEGDPIDYVPNAPLSREEMKQEIRKMVDAMDNEKIRQITDRLLTEYEKEFFSYPAAVRNHHNFPGGLAWHSLSMARMAEHVVDQYGWLDRDLLISGILLHDLAKIFEYSQPVLPEYTIEGNLVGHISMGAQLIDRAALSLGVEQAEETMLMKHMLLSHHGKQEYGSPVLPMIPEAEVLTLLDNLDSRLFMIGSMLEQVAPGCFGPRSFALDNRMFYRKTWNNENGHPVSIEQPNEAPAESGNSQPAVSDETANPVYPVHPAKPGDAPDKEEAPEQTETPAENKPAKIEQNEEKTADHKADLQERTDDSSAKPDDTQIDAGKSEERATDLAKPEADRKPAQKADAKDRNERHSGGNSNRSRQGREKNSKEQRRSSNSHSKDGHRSSQGGSRTWTF